MKNLKLKVIIGGIFGISIISIIGALLLDCTKYGVYIAFWDIGSILMWILVGNFLVNERLKQLKKYDYLKNESLKQLKKYDLKNEKYEKK